MEHLKEAFWNEEVGDFRGWDNVATQVKQGRQILKQYVDFLKQRSVAEDIFGKSLLKLAKTTILASDVGSMNDVWLGLVSQTESIGYNHLECSRLIVLEANRIAEVHSNIREERKVGEESVRLAQQRLRTDYKKFTEARRTYEQRCGEEISTNQIYYQEVAKKGKSSKEADKAHVKYDKASFALKCAELNYHSLSGEAEDSRSLWEKETEDCLELFEAIEDERFELIRDSLWRVSNFISARCVGDDNSSEEMRILLEGLCFQDCLHAFIKESRTGEPRPGKIAYETLPTSNSDGLGHASRQSRVTPHRECSSASATPTIGRVGSLDLNRSLLKSRRISSDSLPKKPPRLIHYASSASKSSNATGLPTPHPRGTYPYGDLNHVTASRFPLVDSVDNIEYFNLSDTPPSSDSQASDRSTTPARCEAYSSPDHQYSMPSTISPYRWPRSSSRAYSYEEQLR